MSIEIVLNRVDRVYRPGEKVTGAVVVTSQGSMSHNGIRLLVEGSVQLQLSARSIGLFEAFYSSLKPVELLRQEFDVCPSGKFASGVTELPFEFVLRANEGEELFDTYHGVYVNVQYMLTANLTRGMMAKNVTKQREFVVELAGDAEARKAEEQAKPFTFRVSPESLQNVKESSKKKIPEFVFEGRLDHTNCLLSQPLSGELLIQKCAVDIKSIELQLVRVESCTYLEGEAREATEIQNIQIAEGNIVRGLSIPIFMVFPRLFTCATTLAKQFKIEFEVNLIILFADNHMVTENFPLRLFR